MCASGFSPSRRSSRFRTCRKRRAEVARRLNVIDEIQVENIALIKEASMAPSPRLTALTGETGAGKTALLTACKLLLGQRADKDAVREGSDGARVSGRFFLGDASGEGEAVVTRRVSVDGRSRATINGAMASISELSSLIGPSVDLCGQHEHQRLLKPASHLLLLDAWAKDEVAQALADYRAAFESARAARRALDQLVEARGASEASLDEARFALRQIDSVNPSEGEYEELTAYLDRAEHAEVLARSAHNAYIGLSGEGGALEGLNAAVDAVFEGARFDEGLAPFAQSLREAGYVLEDVAREMVAYRDGIEYDPEQLAHAQERIASIQGLMRSYGPRLEDVLVRREEAYDLVSAVDDADVRERAARAALDAAEESLSRCADALDEARLAAAPRFSEEVNEVMARLEMPSSELICKVERLERSAWTANGPSAVEFFFRPGAAMRERPLARIASGGEVSRVMLAIHVVLGERDETSTLVFDEVDAGVGGATAVSLAAVLSDLAATHQVIVVTHLPQVAVAADVHYVVEKVQGDVPETRLRSVTGEERAREIARMLSGSVSDASLAHARDLLTR